MQYRSMSVMLFRERSLPQILAVSAMYKRSFHSTSLYFGLLMGYYLPVIKK